jgi:DNA-binding CsgD family transcriptional regulator
MLPELVTDRVVIPLTPREHEVAELYVTRIPEKLIAARLHLSPRTVEFYTRRVREKCGVRSREELIALGLTEVAG